MPLLSSTLICVDRTKLALIFLPVQILFMGDTPVSEIEEVLRPIRGLGPVHVSPAMSACSCHALVWVPSGAAAACLCKRLGRQGGRCRDSTLCVQGP